jgi:N-acetylneuraminic acid mutarotase
MGLIKRIFLAALVWVVAGSVVPQKVSAQSGTLTDDGFVSANATTQLINIKGQGPALIVAGSSATVGSTQVGTTKIYLKFQLQSSLPSSAAAENVAKATLKLFASTGTNPSGSMDLYAITSSWSESTLSSSAQPSLASTPFATGISVSGANSFVVIDVTTLVQEWLRSAANGGLENDGIALVAHSSSSYAAFDSKEGIVTSHEPRLEIVLVNSGPQGAPGPTGPQGLTGPSGPAGASGATATVQVGTTLTVPEGTPASVLNGGTANAAVLNFLIPQGQTGAAGPPGPAGINNRGAWNAANAYSVSDAVSDQGSFWIAVQVVPANMPNSEPSSTNTNWQLLAAQGAAGTAGAPGPAGPAGLPGPMGLPGIPGPVGPMPTGTALTTDSNTFNGNQTVNGSLILKGPGSGVQFADGSVLSSAAAVGVPAGFMIMGPAPVPPPGYTLGGAFNVGDLWSAVSPMPTGRFNLASADLNGKIYAIGGSFTWTTVEVYNPTTDTWATAAPLPTTRSGLGAAAVNGKIYAIGGIDINGQPQTTMEVYDPTQDSWTSIIAIIDRGLEAGPLVVTYASLPTARSQLAVTVLNGKIYAMGGEDASGTNLNTVEVYDPSTNKWSAAAPLPTGASGLAATAVNGKIYAMGGFAPGKLNTLQVYDPSSDSWSSAASMPTPKADLSAATLNGKVYAIGGLIDTPTTFNGPTNTVDVYDPATDVWRSAAPMLNSRGQFGACTVSGFIYAFGGSLPFVSFTGAAEQYFPSARQYLFLKN